MPVEPEIVVKLDELLKAIRAYPDPRRASAEWKQVFNLLKKTDAPANHVANVVAGRDLASLAEMIKGMHQPQAATPGDAAATVDDATCKAALRAFKKRLKLMRLDEESGINSRNPLTGGRASKISAILPPKDWPVEAWEELARQGKLRASGKGFYELVDESN